MCAMSSHENPNFGATDRWLTPLSIVRSLGDFDLDPCGESFHITAKTIWTQNGLERDWFGRVWLNPPYSEVGKWVSRLAKHGHGVALVFAGWIRSGHRISCRWQTVFFSRGAASSSQIPIGPLVGTLVPRQCFCLLGKIQLGKCKEFYSRKG